MEASLRAKTFEKCVETLSNSEAVIEGNRCLECGCDAVHTCSLLDNIKDYEIDTSKEYLSEHRRVVVDDHEFIERDSDKCIQCSLCIRVCSDVIGVEALGLIDRGFEAFVAPEFNRKLSDSSCVSCGACIEICPTGALKEKLTLKKDVPLPYTEVDSYCTKCDVACEVTYHLRGEEIYKVTPRNETGVLCVDGKFKFEHLNVEPIERNVHALDLQNVAFLISPVLGNEELDELKQYAKTVNGKVFTTLHEANRNCETIVTKKELVDKVINGEKRPINTLGGRTLLPVDTLKEHQEVFDALVTIGIEDLDFEFGGKVIAMDDKETTLSKEADMFIPLTNVVYTNQTITRGNCDIINLKKVGNRTHKSNIEKVKEIFN